MALRPRCARRRRSAPQRRRASAGRAGVLPPDRSRPTAKRRRQRRAAACGTKERMGMGVWSSLFIVGQLAAPMTAPHLLVELSVRLDSEAEVRRRSRIRHWLRGRRFVNVLRPAVRPKSRLPMSPSMLGGFSVSRRSPSPGRRYDRSCLVPTPRGCRSVRRRCPSAGWRSACRPARVRLRGRCARGSRCSARHS